MTGDAQITDPARVIRQAVTTALDNHRVLLPRSLVTALADDIADQLAAAGIVLRLTDDDRGEQ